jgi:hypothetical protein
VRAETPLVFVLARHRRTSPRSRRASIRGAHPNGVKRIKRRAAGPKRVRINTQENSTPFGHTINHRGIRSRT